MMKKNSMAVETRSSCWCKYFLAHPRILASECVGSGLRLHTLDVVCCRLITPHSNVLPMITCILYTDGPKRPTHRSPSRGVYEESSPSPFHSVIAYYGGYPLQSQRRDGSEALR